MQRHLLHIVVLLLVVTAVSCTRTSRHPQLVAADSLLLSQPDSALVLLRSMHFTSESDRMYHTLLLADACNKCYDTLPSDSLLREVADFYDSHGTPNEQVRAHYLLGCAYRDLGEAPQALDCYHDAIDRADTLANDCNYQVLSRVYMQISDLYTQQNLPENALSPLKQAIRYAYISGDTLVALKMSEFMMVNLEEMKHYDEALALGSSIHQQYLDIDKPDLAAISLFIPIVINVTVKHDIAQAHKLIDEYEHCSNLFDEKGNIETSRNIYNYVKGQYYIDTSHPDSAEIRFRLLMDTAGDENEEEAAYKGLYTLYKETGMTDSVAKYAELCYQAQDTAFSLLTTDNLQRMQAMYDYSQQQIIAEKKTKEADRNKMTALSLSFLLILAVIIAFIIVRNIRYRKNAEIKAINTQYNIALLQFQKVKAELYSLREQRIADDATIKEKETEITNLQEVISQFHDDNWKPDQWRREDDIMGSEIVARFHTMASTGNAPTLYEWNTLKSAMKQYLPRFMDLIENNDLSFNEIAICILIKLRFVPSELLVLLQMNYQSIANSRARMHKKLFKEVGGAKEFDHRIRSFE